GPGDGVGRGALARRAHSRCQPTRGEGAAPAAGRGRLPRPRGVPDRAREAGGCRRSAAGDDRRRECVGAPQPERAQRALPAPGLGPALLRTAASCVSSARRVRSRTCRRDVTLEGCRATAWGRSRAETAQRESVGMTRRVGWEPGLLIGGHVNFGPSGALIGATLSLFGGCSPLWRCPLSCRLARRGPITRKIYTAFSLFSHPLIMPT